MVKIKYKTIKNLRNISNGVAFNFVQKDLGQEIKVNPDSQKLGITTVISYICLYLWVYGTAYYSGKLSWADFSMSSAFQYSNHRVGIILVLLTVCLFNFFLKSQNIYAQNNSDSSIIIATLFTSALLWLLLFVVYPKEPLNHGLIAIFLMVSISLITYFVYSIYINYYEEDGLNELKISSYICLIVTVIAFFLIMSLYLTRYYKLKYISRWAEVLFYSSELLVIISFMINLIIMSTLPPVLNKTDIMCFHK